MSSPRSGIRRWSLIAVTGAGAFVAGAVAIGVISAASAQTDTTSPSPSASAPGYGAQPGQPAKGNRDESQPQRSDEKLLTGTDAEKAKAAALAKYPGATIQRVETDSDGVYEAHLITSDGKRVTAEMDKNFTITGEEAAGPPK
jgi:hypothetical protein